jgi:hypothetical protein
MKFLVSFLTLAAMIATPALADQPGGISGYVTDATTGHPVAHAKIFYYRAPYLDNGPNHVMMLKTNANGFFSDVTLQPGRYIVMARSAGKVEGCAVDDVMGGEVARVSMVVGGANIVCSGPRVHPALVDPNATADVYRI